MSNLHLTRIGRGDESQESRVIGSVSMLISKASAVTENTLTKNVVTVGGREKSVVNAYGGVKINEYDAAAIERLYSWKVEKDSYLNVRVTLWGTDGDRLMKADPKPGDAFEFFFSSSSVNEFGGRKRLDITAYDFEIRRRKDNGDAERIMAFETTDEVPVVNGDDLPF